VLFSGSTGVGTKNLSQPGAQVADALDWTKKLNAGDTLVLIEIGGNDLIAGTPTADFDYELKGLLQACVRPGRTVVMFELPLLPHRIGYGRSQRRLAAKYGVILIPKRYLVQVLAGEGATSDGLHLSAAGARQMADLVSRALAPLLASGPATH
jgi:lysophospholipase L1-like esterase